MTVDYIGFAYAITVAAGGVIGYVKAGKFSIISVLLDTVCSKRSYSAVLGNVHCSKLGVICWTVVLFDAAEFRLITSSVSKLSR